MSDASKTRVLVIEPQSSGVELVRVARQLGMTTVVASFNHGERRLPDAMRQYVDLFVEIDPNDEAALTERVLQIHAATPLHGVIPGTEAYVATAARLADRLGLPGHPAASAEALRDKHLMRARVQQAGIRVPRYALATDAESLAAAADHVEFPAVLKPVASSGSIQVTRVDDRDQLERAYQRLLQDDRPDDTGLFLDGRVLLEEYLPGADISAEGYVDGDAVVVVSVTKKLVGLEPHFVEVGHIVQHDMDPAERAAVTAYVTEVCFALGIALGPFHCELRLVDGEPVLIEMGARLAGGRIPTLIEWVTGVSLHQVMLLAHTGMQIDARRTAAPRAKYAGNHLFTAPELPILTEVHGLDRVEAAEFVREVELYLRPGEPIDPNNDFRSRIGHALFVADTYADAINRRTLIESMVRFA